MQKLYNLINNDKCQHFVYGIAIYAVASPFGSIFAFILLGLIAWAKEKIDSKGYGQYEIKDFAYTIGGGVFLELWRNLIEIILGKF
jgi:hypothetical protein